MADLITGYAIVFGQETVIGGEFRERVAVGALDRTLRERPDVIALISHDYGRVLGRTSSKTLTLRPDRIGLHFSLDVDTSTPEGQSALGTVRRGDVRGCSFGFRIKAETWEDGGRRLPLRTITDLDLFEMTLTASPAYPGTSAAIVQNNAVNGRRRIEGVRRAEAAMRRRGISV